MKLLLKIRQNDLMKLLPKIRQNESMDVGDRFFIDTCIFYPFFLSKSDLYSVNKQ